MLEICRKILVLKQMDDMTLEDIIVNKKHFTHKNLIQTINLFIKADVSLIDENYSNIKREFLRNPEILTHNFGFLFLYLQNNSASQQHIRSMFELFSNNLQSKNESVYRQTKWLINSILVFSSIGKKSENALYFFEAISAHYKAENKSWSQKVKSDYLTDCILDPTLFLLNIHNNPTSDMHVPKLILVKCLSVISELIFSETNENCVLPLLTSYAILCDLLFFPTILEFNIASEHHCKLQKQHYTHMDEYLKNNITFWCDQLNFIFHLLGVKTEKSGDLPSLLDNKKNIVSITEKINKSNPKTNPSKSKFVQNQHKKENTTNVTLVTSSASNLNVKTKALEICSFIIYGYHNLLQNKKHNSDNNVQYIAFQLKSLHEYLIKQYALTGTNTTHYIQCLIDNLLYMLDQIDPNQYKYDSKASKLLAYIQRDNMALVMGTSPLYSMSTDNGGLTATQNFFLLVGKDKHHSAIQIGPLNFEQYSWFSLILRHCTLTLSDNHCVSKNPIFAQMICSLALFSPYTRIQTYALSCLHKNLQIMASLDNILMSLEFTFSILVKMIHDEKSLINIPSNNLINFLKKVFNSFLSLTDSEGFDMNDKKIVTYHCLLICIAQNPIIYDYDSPNPWLLKDYMRKLRKHNHLVFNLFDQPDFAKHLVNEIDNQFKGQDIKNVKLAKWHINTIQGIIICFPSRDTSLPILQYLGIIESILCQNIWYEHSSPDVESIIKTPNQHLSDYTTYKEIITSLQNTKFELPPKFSVAKMEMMNDIGEKQELQKRYEKFKKALDTVDIFESENCTSVKCVDWLNKLLDPKQKLMLIEQYKNERILCQTLNQALEDYAVVEHILTAFISLFKLTHIQPSHVKGHEKVQTYRHINSILLQNLDILLHHLLNHLYPNALFPKNNNNDDITYSFKTFLAPKLVTFLPRFMDALFQTTPFYSIGHRLISILISNARSCDMDNNQTFENIKTVSFQIEDIFNQNTMKPNRCNNTFNALLLLFNQLFTSIIHNALQTSNIKYSTLMVSTHNLDMSVSMIAQTHYEILTKLFGLSSQNSIIHYEPSILKLARLFELFFLVQNCSDISLKLCNKFMQELEKWFETTQFQLSSNDYTQFLNICSLYMLNENDNIKLLSLHAIRTLWNKRHEKIVFTNISKTILLKTWILMFDSNLNDQISVAAKKLMHDTVSQNMVLQQFILSQSFFSSLLRLIFNLDSQNTDILAEIETEIILQPTCINRVYADHNIYQTSLAYCVIPTLRYQTTLDILPKINDGNTINIKEFSNLDMDLFFTTLTHLYETNIMEYEKECTKLHKRYHTAKDAQSLSLTYQYSRMFVLQCLETLVKSIFEKNASLLIMGTNEYIINYINNIYGFCIGHVIQDPVFTVRFIALGISRTIVNKIPSEKSQQLNVLFNNTLLQLNGLSKDDKSDIARYDLLLLLSDILNKENFISAFKDGNFVSECMKIIDDSFKIPSQHVQEMTSYLLYVLIKSAIKTNNLTPVLVKNLQEKFKHSTTLLTIEAIKSSLCVRKASAYVMAAIWFSFQTFALDDKIVFEYAHDNTDATHTNKFITSFDHLIKELNETLKQNTDKKSVYKREGSLFMLQAITALIFNIENNVFIDPMSHKNEPLKLKCEQIVELKRHLLEKLLPVLLMYSYGNDTASAVRQAASDTFGAMSKTMELTQSIIPTLVQALSNAQAAWRTQIAAIQMLSSTVLPETNNTDTENLTIYTVLPIVMSHLVEKLCDSHDKIRDESRKAIKHISTTFISSSNVTIPTSHTDADSTEKDLKQTLKTNVTNDLNIEELKKIKLALLDDLIGAMSFPDTKMLGCLKNLLESKVLAIPSSIDAGLLALIMPVIKRAMNDRNSECRRLALTALSNIFSHHASQKDIYPYLEDMARTLKLVIIDPLPEVRNQAAYALGNLVSILINIKKSTDINSESLESIKDLQKELLEWLMATLISDVSSVNRSGAAQGMSVVIHKLGYAKLQSLTNDIIYTLKQRTVTPFVKDGYLMLFIYLPTVFGNTFIPIIDRIVPTLLMGLADESEFVRETAIKAGKNIINTFSIDVVSKSFLPQIELGLLNLDTDSLKYLNLRHLLNFDNVSLVTISEDENNPAIDQIGEKLYLDSSTHQSQVDVIHGWRIRYSCLQIISELMFKLSGVSGKMTTLTMDNDDTFASDNAQKVISEALGQDSFKVILAGLYLCSNDIIHDEIRGAALHVWKIVVANTVKALKLILPVLFPVILAHLSLSTVNVSADYHGDEGISDEEDDTNSEVHSIAHNKASSDKDQELAMMAGNSLGSIVKKMEGVLPEILSKLKTVYDEAENLLPTTIDANPPPIKNAEDDLYNFEDDKLSEENNDDTMESESVSNFSSTEGSFDKSIDETRIMLQQGCCLAIQYIMANSSKEMIIMYAEPLNYIILRCLYHESYEMRCVGLRVFDKYHALCGSSALENIIPSLIKELDRQNSLMHAEPDKYVENTALEGLKELMEVKSRAILPYIIPKLELANQKIGNQTKYLYQLISFSSQGSLDKYSDTLLPKIQQAISFMVPNIDVFSYLHATCADKDFRKNQENVSSTLQNQIDMLYTFADILSLLEQPHSLAVFFDRLIFVAFKNFQCHMGPENDSVIASLLMLYLFLNGSHDTDISEPYPFEPTLSFMNVMLSSYRLNTVKGLLNLYKSNDWRLVLFSGCLLDLIFHNLQATVSDSKQNNASESGDEDSDRSDDDESQADDVDDQYGGNNSILRFQHRTKPIKTRDVNEAVREILLALKNFLKSYHQTTTMAPLMANYRTHNTGELPNQEPLIPFNYVIFRNMLGRDWSPITSILPGFKVVPYLHPKLYQQLSTKNDSVVTNNKNVVENGKDVPVEAYMRKDIKFGALYASLSPILYLLLEKALMVKLPPMIPQGKQNTLTSEQHHQHFDEEQIQTLRDLGSQALSELIKVAPSEALQPYCLKIIGPMLRFLTQKHSFLIKAQYINVCGMLLFKNGKDLKPFVPQLQMIFLKVIKDYSPFHSTSDDRTKISYHTSHGPDNKSLTPEYYMRLQAGRGLGHLMPIHPRPSSVLMELVRVVERSIQEKPLDSSATSSSASDNEDYDENDDKNNDEGGKVSKSCKDLTSPEYRTLCDQKIALYALRIALSAVCDNAELASRLSTQPMISPKLTLEYKLLAALDIDKSFVGENHSTTTDKSGDSDDGESMMENEELSQLSLGNEKARSIDEMSKIIKQMTLKQAGKNNNTSTYNIDKNDKANNDESTNIKVPNIFTTKGDGVGAEYWFLQDPENMRLAYGCLGCLGHVLSRDYFLNHIAKLGFLNKNTLEKQNTEYIAWETTLFVVAKKTPQLLLDLAETQPSLWLEFCDCVEYLIKSSNVEYASSGIKILSYLLFYQLLNYLHKGQAPSHTLTDKLLGYFHQTIANKSIPIKTFITNVIYYMDTVCKAYFPTSSYARVLRSTGLLSMNATSLPAFRGEWFEDYIRSFHKTYMAILYTACNEGSNSTYRNEAENVAIKFLNLESWMPGGGGGGYTNTTNENMTRTNLEQAQSTSSTSINKAFTLHLYLDKYLKYIFTDSCPPFGLDNRKYNEDWRNLIEKTLMKKIAAKKNLQIRFQLKPNLDFVPEYDQLDDSIL